MGWKEYYQISPESYFCRFGHELLKRVLGESSHSPLAQKESLRLVLGGFSPHSSTAAAFIESCRSLRPKSKDEIFLLDLNRQPFEISIPPSSRGGENPVCLQADLAEMPFPPGSLDCIWLDGTTNFMDDEKLACFGKEAERTLNKEGIVISIFPEPLVSFLPFFRSVYESRLNRTRVYPRSAKATLGHLRDLKLICHLEAKRETALFFSRKDSPYEPFSGRPFALEALDENFIP
ncbi:methyltransferase domain-containing protein [Candidatus Shapirobacteria bacterium]|nr:methyltransferase domain-containing protein [Candidatus Shapirobacteria bacterium]